MDELNPYAPSALNENLVAENALEILKPVVSTRRVCFTTLWLIAVSGGLFGVGMALISFLPSLLSIGSDIFPQRLISMLMGGFFLFVIGFAYALIPALVIVGILWVIVPRPKGRRPKEWTPGSIRLFGSISGGLSGFSCIAVPAILMAEVDAFLYGLVPGGFAAVVVPLLQFRLVRDCRLERAKEYTQLSESPDFSPPVDLTTRKLT